MGKDKNPELVTAAQLRIGLDSAGNHADFLHHTGAMGLNSAKGDAEFRTDLLVEPPGNHQPEGLELASPMVLALHRLEWAATEGFIISHNSHMDLRYNGGVRQE